MKCPNCKSELLEDEYFCTNCGKRIPNKNININTNAYDYDDIDEDDMLIESIAWGALGFFAPLVGLVLYVNWKRTKPKKAKAAGIGALVKVVVALLIMLFLIAYTFYKNNS